MNSLGRLMVLAICWTPAVLHGAEPAQRTASCLVLQPCSGSLAGGKASLTTSALRREGTKFVGNYQLKVFPYAFKNETGTLVIGVSDEAVRKLLAGTPITCNGTAVTAGTGKIHPVTATATPAGAGVAKGTMKISIATINGALILLSSYILTGD